MANYVILATFTDQGIKSSRTGQYPHPVTASFFS
jgi:hypothetical protein